MTNAKDNQLEINKAVSTLKTKLKKLRSNATEWHNTQFKSANDSLYAMFAELYTLYEQSKNNIDNDVETQVRKYVSEACKRKGVKFKTKKPTLQALLVKHLFDDGITADCKRISSYVRVFTLCTTLDEVNSSNIAKWIAERGGVENIRQQQTKNINKNNKLNYLNYSHSIVPGGFEVISYVMRLTPLTSLTRRVATRVRKLASKG